ncbi:hypothetical protein GCM10022403_079070 [Streptomyces coacervatus]|uniref:Secreted protein n=1 Tax=Streptomyces coacervatus TaxID=647381 RepID=A0ABP7J485_9ACTN
MGLAAPVHAQAPGITIDFDYIDADSGCTVMGGKVTGNASDNGSITTTSTDLSRVDIGTDTISGQLSTTPSNWLDVDCGQQAYRDGDQVILRAVKAEATQAERVEYLERNIRPQDLRCRRGGFVNLDTSNCMPPGIQG